MDNRKPRPARTWQRTENGPTPDWIDFDLDEQGVIVGAWLVWHDDDPDHPHPILLSTEQLEEHYQ
jgi:hypothetical protein